MLSNELLVELRRVANLAERSHVDCRIPALVINDMLNEIDHLRDENYELCKAQVSAYDTIGNAVGQAKKMYQELREYWLGMDMEVSDGAATED